MAVVTIVALLLIINLASSAKVMPNLKVSGPSGKTALGTNTRLCCGLPEDQTISHCRFHSSNGTVYFLEEGKILNEQGNEVDQMKLKPIVEGNPWTTCGILLQNIEENDYGNNELFCNTIAIAMYLQLIVKFRRLALCHRQTEWSSSTCTRRYECPPRKGHCN